jgi:hypothetical protein
MALPTLNTFTANTKLESSKVNENFTNLRDRTEVSSSTSHIILTAGTSKLVKITVLRQDNTTDAYTNNSVILTGWGFVQGDGSNKRKKKAVTLGVTLSERPIAIVGLLGYKASDPSHIGDMGSIPDAIGDHGINANIYACAATAISIEIVDADAVIASGTRIGYSWLAIGALA